MTDRWEMADRLVSLLARRWTLKLLGQLADDGRRHQELRGPTRHIPDIQNYNCVMGEARHRVAPS
jgi:hypothetical protein